MTQNRKHIVILAEDQYEDQELWYPLLRFQEAGATVTVIGPEAGKEYTSKHGYPVTAGATPCDADPEHIDALIVPGGYAPDRIRRHEDMVQLVKKTHDRGGIIAFICHGGWVPISAGILRGRKATSFSAIKDDMVNAGADWHDKPVIRDGNLISSRTPADLPVFCKTIMDALTGEN